MSCGECWPQNLFEIVQLQVTSLQTCCCSVNLSSGLLLWRVRRTLFESHCPSASQAARGKRFTTNT